MSERRILLGVIGRPHGVRGLVRVVSYTEDPSDLAAYGGLTDDAGRQLTLDWRGDGIAAVTLHTDAGPKPVADRNAAAALVNTRLYVPRDRLPPPDADDDFYVTDLIGLVAEDIGGAPLGRITTVHDYGAGPSLEIARDGAPPLLVPFTRAAVPVVDPRAGHVRIVPPAELDAADDRPAERTGDAA